MYDMIYFLGLHPDPLFDKYKKEANPHLFSLLTSGGDYLQTICLNDIEYYGKTVPTLPSFEQLELLEANISSLIKKLTPNYPIHLNPLRLIAQYNTSFIHG